MQTSTQTFLFFLVASFGATHAASDVSAVTPVQKVIQLMNGMLEKGKAEKNAEQVQYAAYKQWCDDTTRQKTTAIAEANEMIEVLKADIQKYAADADLLSKQIAKHEEDITVWNGDQKAATNVRDIEKADYDAAHADYSESIDALGRAIAVLKKQMSDKKQAAAFAQLSKVRKMPIIPDDAKRTIDAFLAQDPQGMDYVAPEANAYEFQSSGIVDMLADLLRKFTDERTTLEKEETSALQAFEMLMSDLDSQIANAQAGMEKDRTDKAKALKDKASAEGELGDTTATRDEDQKFLDDTTAECAQKASDFESRQQLRAEEIEAIEKAIEIISSNAVSGAASKHLPSLVQQKAASLAQFRSDTSNPAQFKVAIYLQDKARELNSRILGALAARVEKDPFKKVKKMIKDLIDKLMEEANAEAAHKGWCDTELATNEKTRKEKTDAVETLKSEIDELTASIAKLGEEITELSNAVADLDAAVAKATKMREDEKVKNAATMKDAQEAQTAVAQALTVLKEFYAKAGKATAFVQQPEIFDKPYKGMGGMAGGVVGMLEVIESDFARVQAETSAAEAQAVKEYEQFMHDSTVDKADMERDIQHKKTKKENEENAVVEQKVDLEGTQKELDAALRYYDKLKPSCVDSGVSYEDRVARRKEEIQSLQEALKILNGEDI
jgi:cell division septum initiation protein DivIVA